jgi:hypothetical protein
VYAAHVLLQRLKARFPTMRGSSGHHLFIFVSKVICDDTYSNKLWSIVAQGMFTLREINQMECENVQLSRLGTHRYLASNTKRHQRSHIRRN